jgi:hypothetical protein
VDRLEANPIETIRSGDKVLVDGDKGLVEVEPGAMSSRAS